MSSYIYAQPPDAPAGQPPPGVGQGRPGGGFGPPGGFMAMMMGQERKIVKQFDKDGDKRLNQAERQAAREFLKEERAKGGGQGGFRGFPGGGRPGGGFGPPGGGFGPPGFGRRENQEPPKPGPHVSPADVKSYPNAELYDPTVLRTLFLEFENKDWETELSDFHGTDVEVPATLTVDGKKYPNVGIHFRGMSSYMMVGAGYKRSLNLSLDFADPKQRLAGYKTLNLLNAHEDPTFMDTVLYSHIARQHLPTPKANFVKVVINGESWGIYTNVQQFDKIFLAENYKTEKGNRWKVKGSPMGDAGLNYVGENVADYQRRYDMKSGDDEKAWKALINLCKVLSTTPTEQLEAALKPILDIDSVLWFLALDMALINCDGYWIRASDYSIYLDEKGKFHLHPHDMNEAFRVAGGPGFGGPGGFRGPGGFGPPGGFGGPPGGFGGPPPEGFFPGGPPPEGFGPPGGFPPPPGGPEGEGQPNRPGTPNRQGNTGRPRGFGMGGPQIGVELDPLYGMNDERKPLRSRLLAVPSLRARYLQHIRALATETLDWAKLGPVVAQYRSLVASDIKTDTHKLESYEAFQKATSDAVVPASKPQAEQPPMRGPREVMSLRAFADQRRKYLLNYSPDKKATPPSTGTPR